MKTDEIVELFEPKFPPVNLYILPPAWFFYRHVTEKFSFPKGEKRQQTVDAKRTITTLTRDR